LSDIKAKIDLKNLPIHVAVTMDGNGRWAKQRGKFRVFGHQNAIKAVRDTTEAAAELGIKYLTLYTFSSENWNRPDKEVNALMQLLSRTLNSETKTLLDNNIKLNTIGRIEKLPSKVLNLLEETKKLTESNNRMTLTLALSYSSRNEIFNAAKKLVLYAKENNLTEEDLKETHFQNFLETKNIPDPELMIRTSGEHRISNFLMYQMAYTELYFTDVFWPDFRKENLYEAIIDYQDRERRFGKTSEQV